MLWNSFPRTLKTRLALCYALLFALSSVLIFWVFFRFISRSQEEAEERMTRSMAVHAEAVYVMGSRFVRVGDLLPESSYPEVAKQKLLSGHPGARILFLVRSRMQEEGDDLSLCSVYLFYRKAFYLMRFQKDGALFSQKLNVLNNRELLRQYFVITQYFFGKENLSLSLAEPDGKKILTANASVSSKRAKRYFRYHHFLFADGRTLTIGRNELPLHQKRDQYLLIFCLISIAAMIAGSIASWLLTKGFIRGIRRVTFAMKKISSGDYAYRLGKRQEDSEIQEMIEKFDAMNARTEELLTNLKMVSENVAHDLRTPLTRISGTLELLLCDRSMPEKVISACASAEDEIQHMKALVNTIMDISRTSSRPDLLNAERVDFADLLREFTEIVRPAVEEKPLAFPLAIPDSPVWINADRMKLERLVSNLWENALKFTEAGEIRLSLSREGANAVFRISDTGCGIPKEQQSRVYDRFFRSDRSRNLPGNGLGLALVLAIVKAHNWQIELESEEKKGSCFTLMIPLAR